MPFPESSILPPRPMPAKFAALLRAPRRIAKCADSGTSLSKYRQLWRVYEAVYAKRPRFALGKKQSEDASRTQMQADCNSGKLCADQEASYLQAAFEPATCLGNERAFRCIQNGPSTMRKEGTSES
jgi:hypothetical protein